MLVLVELMGESKEAVQVEVKKLNEISTTAHEDLSFHHTNTVCVEEFDIWVSPLGTFGYLW